MRKVDDYGWSGYLQANPRPSHSLTNTRASWSLRTCAYYDARTDVAWTYPKFIARPLSDPWNEKLLPALAINPSRLVVAAGGTIYSYKFTVAPREQESPPVTVEGHCRPSPLSSHRHDITAITFVDDNDLDHTLYIGYQDGSLERATIIEPSRNRKSPFLLDRHKVDLPPGYLVRSLSSSGNCLLSLTASGQATLSSTDLALVSSSSIQLNICSWTSHLCLNAPCPYAAFGMSSAAPLTVHAISQDGLRAQPTAILQPKKPTAFNAVYGLAQAPTSSPWGSSPQILVSGWFDGSVRCFDLRSSTRSSVTDQATSGCAPLRPALSLSDPLSDETIYSVSCGGGFSSHIAAGAAHHGVVSFWDVRALKKGWSVHAPGNDPSPVYSIKLESSRLFGVTQSRPFVYDFVRPSGTHHPDAH